MFSHKSLSNAFLVAAITIAGASAFVTAPAEAGGECSAKGKDSTYAEVKAACGKGQSEAKKMMKAIEKKAKAAAKAAEKAGTKPDENMGFKCSECHADTKTYPLKEGGAKKYELWRKYGGY